MKDIYLFLIIPIILDLILGDPQGLPHPIIYVGKTISRYEKYIRKSKVNLKTGGILLTVYTLVTVTFILSLILLVTEMISPYFKILVSIYFLYTSLASRCLDLEAKKVYESLIRDDLHSSRAKLSYLVGRDTSELKREEIVKATVETVAENTIDGVLAPLIFIAIGLYFGYPVQFAFLYKATNTLDSMVGYQNEKYKDIGYMSARLDDALNYIPARVGSICMLFAGLLLKMDFKSGWRILKRDRRNHKSPNCAYPESVIAGLLNVGLGGTHTYFGETVYKPTIGDENRKAVEKDIRDTTKVMYISEIILSLLLILSLRLRT